MTFPFPSRPHRVALAAACMAGFSLGAATPAHASTADDVKALKKAMAEMKADYDRRLASLEQQLQAARAAQTAQAAPATPTTPAVAAATEAAPATAAAPAPASSAMAPAASIMATANAASAPPAIPDATTSTAAPAPSLDASPGGNNTAAFNPSVSLILSGLYTHTTRDPAGYRITGIALPPGAEIGPGSRGFSLSESELAMAANIDPWLRGSINLSISPDDAISAEEAFVQSTSLPEGLGLKAGRFFSGIGYLNSQHSHTWDFVDNPLAYQAFLGTQLADDGVQLRWLAPTDQFIEFGAELGRGRAYPGGFANGGSGSNAPGMFSLTAHTGGDIGDSSSWRAGVSLLSARADAQSLDAFDAGGNPLSETFTGRTKVWVVDGVWKWAPGGNATRTNFKLQGEWLRSERAGGLAIGDGASSPWRATQSGGYVQAVWQFMPMWRVGLRTDRLDLGGDASPASADGFVPRRQSLMFDFNPSEFSRIRLQLSRDEARQGLPDTQWMLQYQTSLGAHGAHAY